jgi:hypothetical protein
MPAHFLKYAVIASNLSPKLSEIDLIDAVAGHYPACIQRSLVSASVRNVQEAPSFLNKLEAMESGDTGRDANRGPSHNRSSQPPAASNSPGRFERGKYKDHHNVRHAAYRGGAGYNHKKPFQSYDARGVLREQYFNRGSPDAAQRAAQQRDGPHSLNPQAGSKTPNGNFASQNADVASSKNRSSENSDTTC